MTMKKYILYTLAGVLMLLGTVVFYVQHRATAEVNAVAAPAAAQEADCATPPPPEAKPPAPAEFAMTESCGGAADSAPPASVR